jgi:hypothetical protein
VLKLGLDLHYRQVTLAMQEDGGRIKAGGKMSYGFSELGPKEVGRGLADLQLLRSGSQRLLVGYWLDRELVALGVKNLVVVPKAMDPGGKKHKTDKSDSGQL